MRTPSYVMTDADALNQTRLEPIFRTNGFDPEDGFQAGLIQSISVCHNVRRGAHWYMPPKGNSVLEQDWSCGMGNGRAESYSRETLTSTSLLQRSQRKLPAIWPEALAFARSLLQVLPASADRGELQRRPPFTTTALPLVMIVCTIRDGPGVYRLTRTMMCVEYSGRSGLAWSTAYTKIPSVVTCTWYGRPRVAEPPMRIAIGFGSTIGPTIGRSNWVRTRFRKPTGLRFWMPIPRPMMSPGELTAGLYVV